MEKKLYRVLVCLVVPCHLYAMEVPKKYSKKLENPGKTLIVIQAILNGSKSHIKVKPSGSKELKIHAQVKAQDVEQQEKHYTEEQFYPFFVDQTSDTISITPYIAGRYKIYIPLGATLSTPNGTATFEIDACLRAAPTNAPQTSPQPKHKFE